MTTLLYSADCWRKRQPIAGTRRAALIQINKEPDSHQLAIQRSEPVHRPEAARASALMPIYQQESSFDR